MPFSPGPGLSMTTQTGFKDESAKSVTLQSSVIHLDAPWRPTGSTFTIFNHLRIRQ